jgi:hypothetical protein
MSRRSQLIGHVAHPNSSRPDEKVPNSGTKMGHHEVPRPQDSTLNQLASYFPFFKQMISFYLVSNKNELNT